MANDIINRHLRSNKEHKDLLLQFGVQQLQLGSLCPLHNRFENVLLSLQLFLQQGPLLLQMAPDQFGPLFGLIRYQLFKGRIVDEFVFTANQNGMNFWWWKQKFRGDPFCGRLYFFPLTIRSTADTWFFWMVAFSFCCRFLIESRSFWCFLVALANALSLRRDSRVTGSNFISSAIRFG